MANIAEVVNSHHDRINTHTAALAEIQNKLTQVADQEDLIATDNELDELQARVVSAEKRIAALETRTKHLSTFADTLDGWLTKIKELV